MKGLILTKTLKNLVNKKAWLFIEEIKFHKTLKNTMKMLGLMHLLEMKNVMNKMSAFETLKTHSYLKIFIENIG